MTRFLAFGWVCSLLLSATGAASIPAPEGRGEVSPTGPTGGAVSPSSSRQHPAHTAGIGGDDLSQRLRTLNGREPATTGGGAGSSTRLPQPPLTPVHPTFPQRRSTGDVRVNTITSPSSPVASTANDHQDVKRRSKRDQIVDSPIVDSPKKNEFSFQYSEPEPASWPELLSAQVLIYPKGTEGKYVASGFDVHWDGEGRQGPVFTCNANADKLFLTRNYEQGGRVYSFPRGSVKIRPTGGKPGYFKDSMGDVLFHFEPAEGGDKGLYRIYYSRNGVRDGPPARCTGHEDNIFRVQGFAYPTSVQRIRVVESLPSKVYNTTFQYAITLCDYSGVYDYTSSYGNFDQINMLSGAPDVTLVAPIPGIDEDIEVSAGIFSRTVPSGISALVTIPLRRATLVAVTWEEERSEKVWSGIMEYGSLDGKRTVAGRSTIGRVRRLISVKAYPGDSFTSENCVPIDEPLSGSGVTAGGERGVWFDAHVNYPWVPRLQWM